MFGSSDESYFLAARSATGDDIAEIAVGHLGK
jgi:hypothetical protein